MKNKRLLATVLVLMLCLSLSAPALAEGTNPIEAMGNLIKFFYIILNLIGVFVLGLGIFNFAMAWQEHDAARRAQSIGGIVAGVLLIAVPWIIDAIQNGTNLT